MQVQTTQFGTIDVDDERAVTFVRGLLGHPDRTRFALVQISPDNYFIWLQSLDEPALAFVVTDPATFLPDYGVPLSEQTRADIGLDDDAAAQVLVICSKIDGVLTGNLRGPLVLNLSKQLATQVVLTDPTWSTTHALVNTA